MKTLLLLLLALATPTWAAAPADNAADWYYPAWLAEAPHAPVFQVRDTVNKYGRYASEPKVITLKDLIKFHGHFCGGLVEGATALRVAFDRLFPGEMIDRTDLIIASNNSACGGDVAAYLTGARARFGSHLIDPKLKESDFVVKRLSTGRAVRVVINAATYPHDVRSQMKKIESGKFEPADIDRFQDLQWAYAKKLVSRPAIESVDVTVNPDYAWPEPPCKDLGKRKDNEFKNVSEAH
ncbi:FmdE protein associated with molybdenum formylmethanofuran dehydrogenase [Sulfuritortus calidifontis]|uniref:FmdE protein associated with molybdenum formylmethanofuran dehydrogenase n=1 Tax=Sulfuritortus calidifontis TaxID=1914471 RepID=A0A4V2UQP2_9PROT|nr:formylmethanofuran dehydrogenase subunit E family protein [Sulfuritortus calidifontis]TCS71748.1 FmdE protein associated with molybdenum formylmethanofuran dehydrogenase [Sulfuritortus calidifontis]